MRLPLVLAAASWFTTLASAQLPVGQSTPVGGFTPELSSEQVWLGNPAFGYRVQGAPPFGSAFVAVSAQRLVRREHDTFIPVMHDLALVDVTSASATPFGTVGGLTASANAPSDWR